MFTVKQKGAPKLMYIRCTCTKETSFTGDTCPIICHHCSAILPDALEINRNSDERISYHVDKEIFD